MVENATMAVWTALASGRLVTMVGAAKIPKFTRRANFTRGKKKRRKKEKEGKGSEMIKASLLGESTCNYR